MDSSSFDRLVREHKDMVYAVALSHTRDSQAAEDVAQDAFLKAYKSWEGLRDTARVKTWLYSITRNTAIDWVRRQKRAPNTGLETPDLPAPEPGENPQMEDIIGKLRPDYQEIIRMRYVEELSYSEIGERLRMTSTAVGEKLWRIREYLRSRLRKTDFETAMETSGLI